MHGVHTWEQHTRKRTHTDVHARMRASNTHARVQATHTHVCKQHTRMRAHTQTYTHACTYGRHHMHSHIDTPHVLIMCILCTMSVDYAYAFPHTLACGSCHVHDILDASTHMILDASAAHSPSTCSSQTCASQVFTSHSPLHFFGWSSSWRAARFRLASSLASFLVHPPPACLRWLLRGELPASVGKVSRGKAIGAQAETASVG